MDRLTGDLRPSAEPTHVPATIRLYYTDPMVRAFEATVVSCAPDGERFHVVLDETAFYPTSGGQPFDTGQLGGTGVVDVLERPDEAVVHVTTGPLEAGARVAGAIDWARRFDHMQQHTGQHVLSAVCADRLGAATASVHFGAEQATIDLDREVSPAALAAAETEANRIVWDNRPVRVRFVSWTEAERLPLRKAPAHRKELRLVEIADCDLSACGGTHVPATGMIGMVALTGTERVRGGTRVGFVCGGRALGSHRAFRDLVQAAARTLSVPPAGLVSGLERLQADLKELGRRIAEGEEELVSFRSEALRQGAETIGASRVVLKRVDEASGAAGLKALAVAVTSVPGFVAVLAGRGDPTPVVVARSSDVALDAAALVREVVASLGGRGGGRPDAAQAGIGAPAGDVLTVVRETLARAMS